MARSLDYVIVEKSANNRGDTKSWQCHFFNHFFPVLSYFFRLIIILLIIAVSPSSPADSSSPHRINKDFSSSSLHLPHPRGRDLVLTSSRPRDLAASSSRPLAQIRRRPPWRRCPCAGWESWRMSFPCACSRRWLWGRRIHSVGSLAPSPSPGCSRPSSSRRRSLGPRIPELSVCDRVSFFYACVCAFACACACESGFF